MNNSSQEQTFTITLNEIEESQSADDIIINTVDWNTSSIPSLTTSDIVTLTGSTYNNSSGITIGQIETIDLSKIDSFGDFTNLFKEEFEGRFPDYDRVMEMCKEYPGLEIAYRKFKEVYTMVKEDYDGKQRERRNNW